MSARSLYIIIGVFLLLFGRSQTAEALSDASVIKVGTHVYGVQKTHQSRADSPFGSFKYVNSLKQDPGPQNEEIEEGLFGGPKPLGTRIPVILIHQYNRCDTWPTPDDWDNLVQSFFDDPRDLKSQFKIYRMKWHSNDLSVFDLGGDLRDFLDALDDDDDAGFRGKPIILIGHSTGGLIARSYMQDHWSRSNHPFGGVSGPGGNRVLRLITLATPHHGTPAANEPFRDDYIDNWDATHTGDWTFLTNRMENNGCPGLFSEVDGPQLPHDEPTRSDLHWDNSVDFFAYDSGEYAKDKNKWLQQLNCVPPYNEGHNCTTTNYASKIIAHGGVYQGIESTQLPSQAYGKCEGRYDFGSPEWIFCLTQALFDTVFGMVGDGIVPLYSALYTKPPDGQVATRRWDGYHHFDMVFGKTGKPTDPLFDQIKEDLLAALPDAPVAKMIMSYGGKTGTQGSPLTITVPQGSTATVAFSSVGSSASQGSISAYEWRINVTVRSTASSFSYALGAGSYDARLKVTDSFGQTNTAVGRVIVQEESPPAVLPSVTTILASQVSSTSAVLNGLVTPNAPSATVWFQWGTTTNYGQSSPVQTLTTNLSLLHSHTLSGLTPNTTYHFCIAAQNPAGMNCGLDQTFTTPASVDTVAPSITITSPTSGTTYSTTFSGVSLAGVASDDRAITTVSWVNDRGGSGTPNGTTNWTIPSVSLSPGPNVITVTAWDASGNSWSAELIVVYDRSDNVSPETEILSGPSGTWPSSSFTFTWTGSDNVTPTADLIYTTELEGYDNGSTLYSSATSRSFSGVPNGTYTFWVRARDTAGNIDFTAATRTFTVNEPDLILPTITDFRLGGGGENNDLFRTGREYPIVFEATDNIQPVEADLYYSLTGGAPWMPIITEISLRSGQNVFHWMIPAGAVTSNGALRLVVRDAAGNAQEATFSPFTVLDGTPPTVRVLTPNGGDIWPLGSTQTIRWTASGVSPIRKIRIRLLRNNSVSIVANLDGPATSYSWTLPAAGATNKALMHVIVEDTYGNENEDFSDAFFTLLDPDDPPPPPWHVPQLVTSLPPPPHPSASQYIEGPAIAAGSSEDLHVAAVYQESDRRDGPDSLYSEQQVVYRARRSSIWEPQMQITNYPTDVDTNGSGPLHTVGSVRVAVDLDEHPHVIWIRGRELEFPSFDDDLIYSFFDGISWSPPENLSASVTTGGNSSTRLPAIVVDANNSIQVLWYERDFSGSGGTSYHKVKQGGVWQSTNPVSLPAILSPEMVADATGTVHLITANGQDAVYHSQFDGVQWTAEAIADNLPGFNQDSHLSMGSDGYLHAAWRSIQQDSALGGFSVTLHYSSFDGQNWEPVETVQGGFLNVANLIIAITVNALNNPMVFWIQRAPDGVDFVQVSEQTESGWSPPVQISDRTTLVASATPVVATSGGSETHVAWAGGGIIWNYLVTQTLSVDKSGTGTGTVTSNPTGINCETTCQASFYRDTEVGLAPTPMADSTFGGWAGHADCADGVVIMDADKTCTAIFNLQPPQTFTLTVSIVGGGMVTSSPVGLSCPGACVKDYGFMTLVTLIPNPTNGWSFVGWSGTSDCVDGVVMMNAHRNCLATFIQFLPSPGHEDYCALAGPCAAGQGDCDQNGECQNGLVCMHDVGENYGWPATIDVCEVPPVCGTGPFEQGEDWTLMDEVVTGVKNYRATYSIEAGPAFTVSSTGCVHFSAGERIILHSGFRVEQGGRFEANIE